MNNITKFSSGLKTGFIEVDSLKLGEYAFGNIGDTAALGWKESTMNRIEVKMYPNPAKQTCSVEFKSVPQKAYTIKLTNLEGKVLLTKPIAAKTIHLDLEHLPQVIRAVRASR